MGKPDPAALFRAFLRAVEGRFYQDIELKAPVLDVGCGDGIFAEITFDRKIDIGFDPSLPVLQEPANRQAYEHLLCAGGAGMPFPDAYFSTIISNSVLEHIPELDAVIPEMNRVLKPGGKFIFCVPNDNLLKNLSVSNFLDKLSLHGLAKSYRFLFQYHLTPPSCRSLCNVGETIITKWICDRTLVALFFSTQFTHPGMGHYGDCHPDQ